MAGDFTAAFTAWARSGETIEECWVAAGKKFPFTIRKVGNVQDKRGGTAYAAELGALRVIVAHTSIDRWRKLNGFDLLDSPTWELVQHEPGNQSQAYHPNQ